MSEKSKNLTKNLMSFGIVAIGTIGMLVLLLGLSYAMTALVTWLIFSCFGWDWSWQLALGIWLLALFIRWVLKRSDSK